MVSEGIAALWNGFAAEPTQEGSSGNSFLCSLASSAAISPALEEWKEQEADGGAAQRWSEKGVGDSNSVILLKQLPVMWVIQVPCE